MKKNCRLPFSLLNTACGSNPCITKEAGMSARLCMQSENNVAASIVKDILVKFAMVALVLLPLICDAQIITTIAGNGIDASNGDGGQATSAAISVPGGLAFDGAGNIYFSGFGTNNLRKISPAGIISTIAGTGEEGFSGDGGPATAARFAKPIKICRDASGNIFVVDHLNQRIRKISPAGIVSTYAGNGYAGFSGDHGPATNASLSYPTGVCADAAGNIYIADFYNSRIRKVSTDGIITTVVGNGGVGNYGDGGPATAASLFTPHGVIIDAFGNMFIADVNGATIRKVTSAGIISTVAGTGTSGFSGDGGPATAASLDQPGSVAVDASGNIFIDDFNNFRIRKIDHSTGLINTVVGDGNNDFSGDGGPATAARINYSNEIAFDNSGNLIINDNLNYRIRKVGLCTSTTDAGTISGTAYICAGTTTTLSETAGGGIWGSTNTAVATVGSITGVVTGIGAGVANIYYNIPTICGSVSASLAVTVNAPVAGTIAGPSLVIAGSTIMLSNTASGGIWSASNSNATVSTTGLVTGVAAGIVTISYTATNSCGVDVATKIVSVNAASFCAGGTISTIAGNGIDSSGGDGGPATDAAISVPGGLAFDGAGSIYFSGFGTNNVRKISSSGIISTIAGTGAPGFSGDGGPATAAQFDKVIKICRDASGNIFVVDHINQRIRKISAAGIITTYAGNGTNGFSGDGGPATDASLNYPTGVCVDGAGNLYIADFLNSRVRKVSTAGIITTVVGSGIPGNDGDGGPATDATITTPNSVMIDASGNLILADLYSATIRKVTTAGIISTIAGTGVTGFSGDGGPATAATFDQPSSVAIDANGNIFIDDFNNFRIRKINGITGIITTVVGDGSIGFSGDGGPATSAQLNYSNEIAFDNSGDLIINDNLNYRIRKVDYHSPSADAGTIAGLSVVTTGSTISLSNSVSDGIWSASNSNATVSSTGVVTGAAVGVVTISYTVTNSCGTAVATKTVTVNGPTAISGTLYVCVGAATTLSNTTGGGVWSSANNTIATVASGTGVVTGVMAGTATIIYTLGGSTTTAIVTVNAIPLGIGGPNNVCAGSSITLTNATAGGTWSNSNTTVAGIDVSTGLVSGNVAGTTVISYTSAAGCSKTFNVTVKPLPAAISGVSGLCIGTTATLSDATTGGVSWSSSNTAVAAINAGSGVVTAISAGTTTITYLITSGCVATKELTISALPAVISGTATICVGSAATFTNSDGGGLWSSSNASIATIGSVDGIVTGIAAGVVNITYSAGAGCFRTKSVTIKPLPSAITGSPIVCLGSTTTLVDATAGGTWSSADPLVATIGGTGLVTAIAGGTSSISYVLSTGCMRTTIVTVNAALPAITGNTNTCVGLTTTLSIASTGGTWSSSNTGIASVGAATGVVSGLSAGNANITYTLSAGCKASTTVSIGTAVPVFSGPTYVCINSSITLSNTITGGTWSSSNGALGTIDAITGLMTGIAAGTPIITYTTAAGCTRTGKISVKSLPVAIAGIHGLCTGGTMVVTDATPTGVSWTSSTPSVATIGAGSGVITGISAGTATITYLANSGCTATKVVTVDTAPSAGTITGPSSVITGNAVTLANAASGGVWSSSNTAKATINASGDLTGIASGAATISYTVSNGVCNVYSTKAITVTASRVSPTAAKDGELIVKVYPNPTSGTFTLQASVAGIFTIYTLEGKELSNTEAVEGSTTISLPRGLAAGIYMCRYNGIDGSSTMVRLVFER